MTVRYRIAAVCTGNICRSPMAEAVLRRMLEQDALDRDVSVDSFGISGWHAGDGADPRAVAALHRRGYDITHRARRWRPDLFADLDLVVALDSGHLAELCATAPTPQAAGRVRLLRSFDPDASAPDPATRSTGTPGATRRSTRRRPRSTMSSTWSRPAVAA